MAVEMAEAVSTGPIASPDTIAALQNGEVRASVGHRSSAAASEWTVIATLL